MVQDRAVLTKADQ